MVRKLAALALLVACPTLALAAIVEAPPDDFAIYSIGGGDILQSDTAPSPVADRVLLVWTQSSSGMNPNMLVAGLIEPNTPGGEWLVEVDQTEAFVRDPAVAWDDGVGRYLVVWAQENSPGEYEIFGRFILPDGSQPEPPFRISWTGVPDLNPAADALQPAVSSNERGTFLVAWTADDNAGGIPDGGFDLFHRTVNARTGELGTVVQGSDFASTGGAALQPQLGYLYSVDIWMMTYEADNTPDPNLYTPLIYVQAISGSGLPRTPGAPVRVSDLVSGGAARRTSVAAHNPSIAVDRLNQHAGIVWDYVASAGDGVARRINGVVFDAFFGTQLIFTARDLTAEGYGPGAWVREPRITHSRISGTYVLGWRESFNPADGSGQTILVRELDEVTGLGDPPIPIVNQGPWGPLPTEFGPPTLEGGWRANGRIFTCWVSDATVKGELRLYGQGLDAAAATAAPPDVIPRELALGLAPNPFNPKTSIELSLPVAGRARVDIYDVRGRLVRQLVDEELPAGTRFRTWSGLDDRGQRVASGVYMVRLRHPGGERVTKATLVE